MPAPTPCTVTLIRGQINNPVFTAIISTDTFFSAYDWQIGIWNEGASAFLTEASFALGSYSGTPGYLVAWNGGVSFAVTIPAGALLTDTFRLRVAEVNLLGGPNLHELIFCVSDPPPAPEPEPEPEIPGVEIIENTNNAVIVQRCGRVNAVIAASACNRPGTWTERPI